MANRHNYETHTGKNLVTGTLATLGAVSLAAVMDMQAAAYDGRKRSDKADVVTNLRSGEDSIFVVPGYHANGRVIGKNMDRHLEHLGTTHYAVHPERGFNLDSIREAWLNARKVDGHRPAKIYAMSMGALLVAKLFEEEAFRREFGEVRALVLDSALSGSEDVHMSSKVAMALAAILPVTYMSGKLYNLVTGREVHKPIDHAPEVLRREAEEHIESSARTTFDAAKDQILFMRRNSVKKMQLEPFGAEIEGNIIFIASPRDDVLDTDRSAQQISNSLKRDIQHRTDTRRARGTHATGPEHPRGVVDALQYQNSDDYRIRNVKPKFARAVSGLWLPETA